jgi:glycosyltransferase involved in cell wall biosynthesis
MRVVFLTSRMPFPPVGGDRFRVFHLLRTASEAGHEVHLVTFDGSIRSRAEIAPLDRLLASIRVVPLTRLISTLRAAQALPGRRPLQAAYYRSRTMRRTVGELLARVRPDFVYTHLFRMAPYAMEQMGRHRARWILDFTDVISAGIERSLPYRRGLDLWIYREEMKRIRRYEQAVAPRFDECWVISDAERRSLLSLAPEALVRVVPNGLGPEPFHPNGPREQARLLFLGYQEVFHNRDAARFLVEEVFPRVRAVEPDATLDIAGRGAESLGPWARGEGVRIVGFVPRLEDALMHATVFVAPHRFAAGVQNKVVQAMASGTPVVSTPAVRQGLEPMPEGVMRVAEGADAIAAQIVTLIRDPAEAAALGARGREWARSTFTWTAARTALESNGGSQEPARTAIPAVPASA